MAHGLRTLRARRRDDAPIFAAGYGGRPHKASARLLSLLFCVVTAFCWPHDAKCQERIAYKPSVEVEGRNRFGLIETPIEAGTMAGYLPGQSAVTETGEFTYSIVLDVPAGRAGMQPSLSLSYAHRAGNGLLGVGWRLAGLSEVHRCGQTFAQEGYADGIDFDKDSFCLDGQKLVEIPASGPRGAGTGVTEYRTEQDRFARIVASDAGGEPTSFIVYRKDGRILTYEPVVAKRQQYTLPPDSGVVRVVTEVPLVWLLSSERDRAGNEVHYLYEVTVEAKSPYAIEYHPSAIEYTSQRTTSAPARRRNTTSAIGSASLPSASVSTPRLGLEQVRDFLLVRNAELRSLGVHGPSPAHRS